MKNISVCMATYNGEKYIRRQLLSILSQLGPDDEVIISDDQSTDRTIERIRQLNDYRIQISTNEGRRGPLGNFEQALVRATGKLILLADQDDIWMPDKVSTVQSLLQDYDLVLSDCQVVDESEKMLYKSFFHRRGSQPGFWYNLYKNSYIGCCMAFRREVLVYALPFPRYIHMHDWWIGLLVECKGNVCFYPNPLIQYVRHANNASPTGETGYSIHKRIINRLLMLIHVVKRISS